MEEWVGLLPLPEEVELEDAMFEEHCLRMAENPSEVKDIHDYNAVHECYKVLEDKHPEKARKLEEILNRAAEKVARWCIERVEADDWSCEDMVLCAAFPEIMRHVYEEARRRKVPYYEYIQGRAKECEMERVALPPDALYEEDEYELDIAVLEENPLEWEW